MPIKTVSELAVLIGYLTNSMRLLTQTTSNRDDSLRLLTETISGLIVSVRPLIELIGSLGIEVEGGTSEAPSF